MAILEKMKVSAAEINEAIKASKSVYFKHSPFGLNFYKNGDDLTISLVYSDVDFRIKNAMKKTEQQLQVKKIAEEIIR